MDTSERCSYEIGYYEAREQHQISNQWLHWIPDNIAHRYSKFAAYSSVYVRFFRRLFMEYSTSYLEWRQSIVRRFRDERHQPLPWKPIKSSISREGHLSSWYWRQLCSAGLCMDGRSRCSPWSSYRQRSVVGVVVMGDGWCEATTAKSDSLAETLV